MLDSFIFSLNSTLPVFLMILFGMLLRRIGIFNESYASVTDKYVFKVALPVLLFKDLSEMSLRQDFDLGFVLFCVVATLLMFLGSWGGAAIFLKDKRSVGAFAQGCARGSAAILGIALATNIYGSSGYAPLMIFAVVPLFNIMSVVILTVSADNGERRIDLSSLLRNIITNPIIIGVVIGAAFSFLEIPLPAVASKTVNSIASTATPMALIAIGVSFDLAAAREKLPTAAAATFVKLFLLPAVFIPAAVFCGFKDSALIAVFVMVGAPTTVTAYIMSKNMHGDYVLSSNIIMLSTIISSVSITFWVFLMRFTGLI